MATDDTGAMQRGYSGASAAARRRGTALSPLEPRLFEVGRRVYDLDPLLVHARLFGGHYAGAVERTLARFGG